MNQPYSLLVQHAFSSSSTLDRHAGSTRPDNQRERHLAPWRVRCVLRYVEERLTGPLRMSDIVERIGLSTSHFSRAFKGTFGRTFSSWLILRRLERAQTLMQTTPAPLSVIANDCGFCDQAHLTRLFRRVVGLTPNQWRAKQRGEGASPRALAQVRRRDDNTIQDCDPPGSHDAAAVTNQENRP